MSRQEPKRPNVLFRSGGISAAVWVETTTINGRAAPQYSIRIEKRFKDQRTGEWKTTGFLRVDDLPRVELVARKAFEYATLRETDETAMSTDHDG